MTIDEILEGIQSEEVKYGLVDVLNLIPYKQQMDKMNIKVMALERMDSGFGLILSGMSTSLKHDIEDAISERSQTIADFMDTFSDQIPVCISSCHYLEKQTKIVCRERVLNWLDQLRSSRNQWVIVIETFGS